MCLLVVFSFNTVHGCLVPGFLQSAPHCGALQVPVLRGDMGAPSPWLDLRTEGTEQCGTSFGVLEPQALNPGCSSRQAGIGRLPLDPGLRGRDPAGIANARGRTRCVHAGTCTRMTKAMQVGDLVLKFALNQVAFLPSSYAMLWECRNYSHILQGTVTRSGTAW